MNCDYQNISNNSKLQWLSRLVSGSRFPIKLQKSRHEQRRDGREIFLRVKRITKRSSIVNVSGRSFGPKKYFSAFLSFRIKSPKKYPFRQACNSGHKPNEIPRDIFLREILFLPGTKGKGRPKVWTYEINLRSSMNNIIRRSYDRLISYTERALAILFNFLYYRLLRMLFQAFCLLSSESQEFNNR